jgi:hypothetical protein
MPETPLVFDFAPGSPADDMLDKIRTAAAKVHDEISREQMLRLVVGMIEPLDLFGIDADIVEELDDNAHLASRFITTLTESLLRYVSTGVHAKIGEHAEA